MCFRVLLFASLLVSPTIAFAQARQARRVPPAKEHRISVGGHRLHIACRGAGKPAVIFEAGLGRSSADWEKVELALAGNMRVCTYDRAGLGQSDAPGRSRRSAQLMVTELRVLLGRARVNAPFVLVGHSFGGVLVRLFAARYPQDVKGMVLVDSAHEDETARFREIMTPEQRAEADKRMAEGPPMTGPEPVDLKSSFAAARTLQWAADIPLVVLAQGTPLAAGDVPPGWSPQQIARGEETRRELQRELASRSKKGKLIFVEGAGHFIHQDRPDVVIAAIREVVAAARR